MSYVRQRAQPEVSKNLETWPSFYFLPPHMVVSRVLTVSAKMDTFITRQLVYV